MLDLDRDAVRWLSGIDWAPLTVVMKALTYAAANAVLWLAIALVVSIRLRRPLPLAATALVALAAGVLGAALKAWIGRLRPSLADPALEPLIAVPASNSMPSGHALTGFACAVLLGGLAPRLRVPLLVLAALVAFSRVYLGVHYPSDVLVGAAVGALLGVVALRIGLAAESWRPLGTLRNVKR
jgi:undecaprenyl-diphosphatase